MKRYVLSHDEISALCLELALLLHSGVDCASSLTLIAEETDDARLCALFNDIAGLMDEGLTLSQAMEKTGAFPRRVYTMLRVGEAVGRTEESLRAVSAYHDHLAKTDARIRSALLYPSILLFVMLTVIVVLLTQVLPIFNDVYISLGGEMTGLAGALLTLGSSLNGILPVLCAILASCVVLIVLFACSQSFRTWLTGIWKRIRGGKGLAYKNDIADFAGAMSMAINSGLNVDAALDAAGDVLDDRSILKKRVSLCREMVSGGKSLPHSLRDAKLMPAAECRLIELGGASGTMETVMAEVARRMDDDAAETQERVLNRVEPTLVVIASVLVGVILLSVMLPLTQIMTAIG